MEADTGGEQRRVAGEAAGSLQAQVDSGGRAFVSRSLQLFLLLTPRQHQDSLMSAILVNSS